MKTAERIRRIRYGSNEIYTLLTTDILDEFEFEDNGQCKFELFERMSYWVKNSVCLFYNTPIKKDYQESFYVGYAQLRQGKYIAVGFKWIDSVEVLTQIYESITGKSITESIYDGI